MRPNHKRKQGFTLIEVLLSLGVFSFGILAIMQLLGGILLLNNNNISQTRATEVAISILDDTLSTPTSSSNSVRYAINMPTAGTSQQTLYFDLDGNITTNSTTAHYAALIKFSAGNGKCSSVASIVVYWPAIATNPLNHIEVTSLINRS